MPDALAPPFDDPREVRVAWLYVFLVLSALTVAKTVGGLPYIGQAALTGAAFLQLYLPVTRADRRRVSLAALGLTWVGWRKEAKVTATTLLAVLPPYAILYHVFVTRGRAIAQVCLDGVQRALGDGLHGGTVESTGGAFVPELSTGFGAGVGAGLGAWGAYLPHAQWAPHLPQGAMAWALGLGWFCERALTHVLGVALPEEVFYRGYLQPSLGWQWPAQVRIFGTPMGRAVVVASLLFALGHVLGEWNPLRFGPFVPGLLFGWLRNRTGTVMSAIAVHAGCNLFVELFSRLYV